ncbi:MULTISPECIES: hypothetical protein [Synergistaceae]|nr:hypothetical protein [Synergistaceae bacterium DZ-S4]
MRSFFKYNDAVSPLTERGSIKVKAKFTLIDPRVILFGAKDMIF